MALENDRMVKSEMFYNMMTMKSEGLKSHCEGYGVKSAQIKRQIQENLPSQANKDRKETSSCEHVLTCAICGFKRPTPDAPNLGASGVGHWALAVGRWALGVPSSSCS